MGTSHGLHTWALARCGIPERRPAPRGARPRGRRGFSGSARGRRAAPTPSAPAPARVLRPARRRARRAGSWRRRGRRGRGVGGSAAHARTRGRRVPSPGLRAPGTLAPPPRPQPPGAARGPDPSRPTPAGTTFPARVLSPRRGGTFRALPARRAPVPAPPPPRVFRPSKDRATQISPECPLPSGREGIERRARAGHFQGASPEPLKVLFSPQSGRCGGRGRARGRFQLLHTLE